MRERDHLLRPLLGCSFFIVALDVIASITANISQQPPFLTATALTIHISNCITEIYSLLVVIILRIQHLGYILYAIKCRMNLVSFTN